MSLPVNGLLIVSLKKVLDVRLTEKILNSRHWNPNLVVAVAYFSPKRSLT
jgi:hypothetical protein